MGRVLDGHVSSQGVLIGGYVLEGVLIMVEFRTIVPFYLWLVARLTSVDNYTVG